MKKIVQLLAVAVVMLSAGSAFADTSSSYNPADAKEIAKLTSQNFGRSIGAGLGMGLGVVGAGIGLGLIGYSALASIARQPEKIKEIRTNMLIIAALLEGTAVVGIILSFVLVIL